MRIATPISAALLSMVAGVALAQPAPEPPPYDQALIDSATKKLEEKQKERQASATTRPAVDDVTPRDPEGMHAEIMRLRRQLYAEREENRQLRAQVLQHVGDNAEVRQLVEQAQAAAARAEEAERAISYRGRVYYDDYDIVRRPLRGMILAPRVPNVQVIPPTHTMGLPPNTLQNRPPQRVDPNTPPAGAARLPGQPPRRDPSGNPKAEDKK